MSGRNLSLRQIPRQTFVQNMARLNRILGILDAATLIKQVNTWT